MVGLVADVTEDNDLWEEKFLKVVDKASSSQLKYYVMATRSWGDVFGDAITGDLALINLACTIAIFKNIFPSECSSRDLFCICLQKTSS